MARIGLSAVPHKILSQVTLIESCKEFLQLKDVGKITTKKTLHLASNDYIQQTKKQNYNLQPPPPPAI